MYQSEVEFLSGSEAGDVLRRNYYFDLNLNCRHPWSSSLFFQVSQLSIPYTKPCQQILYSVNVIYSCNLQKELWRTGREEECFLFEYEH